MARTLQERCAGVYTIDDFITKAECEEINATASSLGFAPAAVLAHGSEQMLPHIRNNERVMWDDPTLASLLWERLAPVCPAIEGLLASGLNTRMRSYRYGTGQRFKMHKDGSITLSNAEQSHLTFMIYLNDDFEGGATLFKDVTIVPVTGMALLFFHPTWHEGQAVVSGTKLVLRSDVMYGKLP
jgi:predicted 2-oxoglutarate/Fe(II)-dependent dioxygenase YbiX